MAFLTAGILDLSDAFMPELDVFRHGQARFGPMSEMGSLVASMARWASRMPVLDARLEHDYASDRTRIRLLPDLRAQLIPRYCPEVGAIAARDRLRVNRGLDAVETRSTLTTDQGV